MKGARESANDPPLLSVRNVNASIGGVPLLHDLTLTVREGDLVFLLGPNGAGKSSVLRLLLGRIIPETGSVELGGQAIARLSGRERAAGLAYLPQRSTIVESMYVLDLVVAARYRFAEPQRASLAAARIALADAGAAALENRIWTTLSGGEQQRVSLAVLLAQDAKILLFDEPASHLDPAQQIEIYRQIGRLNKGGRSIVCVTHDINLIGRAAAESGRVPKVLGLRDGREQFSCESVSPQLPTHLSDLFTLEVRRLPDLDPATFIFEPRAGG